MIELYLRWLEPRNGSSPDDHAERIRAVRRAACDVDHCRGVLAERLSGRYFVLR